MNETHVVIVVEGIEDVVGEAGEEVDEEPGLEVVHADHLEQGVEVVQVVEEVQVV